MKFYRVSVCLLTEEKSASEGVLNAPIGGHRVPPELYTLLQSEFACGNFVVTEGCPNGVHLICVTCLKLLLEDAAKVGSQ